MSLLFRSVTHTLSPKEQKGKIQWWKIKFGKAYKINLVVIYLRTDCCGQRINGAVVYAASHKCGSVRYIPGHNVYYISCAGTEAKEVKIQTDTNYLSLAEVQVFGELIEISC